MDSTDLLLSDPVTEETPPIAVATFTATGLPPLGPLERDAFERQRMVPGHDQELLTGKRITIVGAGGLGSWSGLGMFRSGATLGTVFDQDFVERSNLSRQFYYETDLGQPKAICLARNLLPHAPAGATITGVATTWEDALELCAVPSDLLLVGVDNNLCRLAASRWARQRKIPAVFTMLSRDAMRCHAFLQGPLKSDPCLWCSQPNLEEDAAMPCAAAVISSCLLAAAFAVFFANRALMGWPDGIEPYNWREADLLGVAPDVIGRVQQRANCRVCRELR
jgi:molybdopterin/thiamine biosynthesis adenylyltransferase